MGRMSLCAQCDAVVGVFEFTGLLAMIQAILNRFAITIR